MKGAPSMKEMAAFGWTRTDPQRRKTSARWEHRDGWRLEHCGHPTANWPWALYDRNGRMVCQGVLGPARNPTFG